MFALYFSDRLYATATDSKRDCKRTLIRVHPNKAHASEARESEAREGVEYNLTRRHQCDHSRHADGCGQSHV